MKKKIAIIGHGYVGKGMERFFKDHFDLVIYDKTYTHIDNTHEAVNKCDLAIICVPTPMLEDGSVDISIVKEVVDWIDIPILIKSTIPPGTTEQLVVNTGKRIVFSPEYMGEGKYFVPFWKYPDPIEMKYHSFQIFGGEKKETSYVLEFFKKVLGPDARLFQTDSKTAELCKYQENAWGATKVIFCNEFAKIAEAFGVDYDELRELWLLDSRVERMHTAVFKDSRGFGGKCFPKDVAGIVKQSEKAGYIPKLLKAVLEVNKNLND